MMMSINNLEIQHEFSLFDSVKFQLKLMIPSLTDRVISILALILLYPNSYEKEIIERDIAISKASIKTRLVELKDLGIVKVQEELVNNPNNPKKKFYYAIEPTIEKVIKREDFTYSINIKLKN